MATMIPAAKTTYEIHFSEVKDAFMAIVADGKPVPANFGGASHGIMPYLVRAAYDPYMKDSWIGGTGADTTGWVRKGFKSDAIKSATKYVKQTVKKRRNFNDSDGMPSLERLYSGDPNFYEKPIKREVKPGMTVNVEMFFSGAVDPQTIQIYGGWVAGFISALETKGLDLEVNVRVPVTALMGGESRSHRSDILMRVKSRGEKARFHAWSCLFAPTGFRHLVFTAFHVAGAKYGKKPTHHLAMSLDRSRFGVNYDRENNTVTVQCDQRAWSIDNKVLDKLTNEAKAEGLL